MFVGGIHPDVTEEEFTEFFQRYGPVLDATLMMDKDSGRPRGFGFITFENDSALEVCVQQQEIILHDKKVTNYYQRERHICFNIYLLPEHVLITGLVPFVWLWCPRTSQEGGPRLSSYRWK